MLVKRKLYSVMDEEGNLGYYLYNEATGEEKLFSVVEEDERLFANLDEDDIKFLEEHARNKERNAKNLGYKKAISSGALASLAVAGADKISKGKLIKPEAKLSKAIKNNKTSLAIGAGIAVPLALVRAKKAEKKSNEIHDKFRDLYINSDKKTREELRKLSNKDRLKLLK
jgi:hypothetical protein